MSTNGVEVIPSAKRLVRSLRDMGYEFVSAVADIIDNSIEARANTVRIDVVWNGGDSYALISDNGKGMSTSELREAMRYGADRDYDTEDLGKFGLGLKTASMSQCSCLTVASRQNTSRADISAYCWDLDHIKATNRWEILQVATASLQEAARQHLKETTGTVVIWERLDRILGYRKPDGEAARKKIAAMCRELEDHLAMVFHRFLAGEVRGKKLAIYMNNNKVMPWDPFARSETSTKKLESVVIRVDGELGKADVVLEPFVLPPQSKFSSPEAFNRASGPNKWNRQQGFYFYRADRLIQSGGWSNLRTLDEHIKLARIALSFSPRLDEEFTINVPKMRVALPATIRDEVLKAIGPVIKLANDAYRSGERGTLSLPRVPASSEKRAHSPSSPKPDGPTDSSFSLPDVSINGGTQIEVEGGGMQKPSLNGFDHGPGGIAFEHAGAMLEKVATPDELPIVQRVIARAKATFGG